MKRKEAVPREPELDARERKKQKQKRIRSIAGLVLFLAASVAIALTFGRQLIAFVSDTEAFRAWIGEQGIWGRLIMVGIVFLQVVVAIIPGEVVEIAAGYAYGPIEGMLLCLAGTALSSALVYLFTRRLGMKMVEAFVPREKIESLSFLQNEKRLNLIVFILFFIPGTPKDVITYFIGLTPMKLTTFLLLSTVARIPSVISSTIGGHALGMANPTFAIVVFAVTAVISMIGIYLYHRIVKRREKKKARDQQGR